MERYIEKGNREQLNIFPVCLDDMISEDNVVRAIDAIVDNMDITGLGFTHSQTATTGRKPYNPADLFKLYTYCYFNGIRSSRKIEKECYRNLEVMWLIHELKPDFKTIADFRKNNKEQIKLAFSKFSLICDSLGLIGKEMIAVDGSKFRASNSRLAYHSERKLAKKIEYYRKTAEQYLKLLEESDLKESSTQTTVSKEDIKRKIDWINNKITNLSELKKEIRESGSICLTDKDSKMMKTNNKGFEISYNVQTAVDEKNHLVVAVDVTSEPVDKEQLHHISSLAKEALKVEKITVIADTGYYSAKQFAKCKKDNIIPIVSKADPANAAADKEFRKSQFKYDELKDGYICPQGHLLKPYNTKHYTSEETTFRRYRNIEACSKCPMKQKCSKGNTGRTIEDRPLKKYADEVDKRTLEFFDVYKKRKSIVEHPFGTIKRGLGFSYFLTRGTASVRAESFMHFLIYNMKRVINILGTRQLIVKLQG